MEKDKLKSMPLVSIVMPAYNAAKTIGQSIESVQAQVLTDWELLVVDDCSFDETCSIVRGYASSDKRINLISQSANGGPARARNVALRVAQGRYIAFLDSDDCWLPKKLERQVDFMIKTKSALSYTLYRRFIVDINQPGSLVELPSSFTYGELLKNTGIGCLTAMIDRELSGPIEFSLIRHEDYALWLSILKNGIVAHGLMEDLGRYRVSSKSVSGNKFKSASWVWNIYRRDEKLSFFQAAWCFSNYAWNAYRKNR